MSNEKEITKKLPKFLYVENLPRNSENLKGILQSSFIKRIFIYPLGSKNNNIGQVNMKFIKKMGIESKTTIEYCQTPEISVKKSIKNTLPNTLSFFWTCAVFHRENTLFFKNPDCFPFFHKELMPLDEMQLCTQPKLLKQIHKKQSLNDKWLIASHGAPASLVDSLSCKVIDAHSNDHAAKQCFQKETELCITTESARKEYGLKTVYKFGSPEMVFFAGIPKHSAEIIANINKILYL